MNLENSKTSDAHELGLVSQIKWIYEEVISLWHYQNLEPTKHGRI